MSKFNARVHSMSGYDSCLFVSQNPFSELSEQIRFVVMK